MVSRFVIHSIDFLMNCWVYFFAGVAVARFFAGIILLFGVQKVSFSQMTLISFASFEIIAILTSCSIVFPNKYDLFSFKFYRLVITVSIILIVCSDILDFKTYLAEKIKFYIKVVIGIHKLLKPYTDCKLSFNKLSIFYMFRRFDFYHIWDIFLYHRLLYATFHRGRIFQCSQHDARWPTNFKFFTNSRIISQEELVFFHIAMLKWSYLHWNMCQFSSICLTVLFTLKIPL